MSRKRMKKFGKILSVFEPEKLINADDYATCGLVQAKNRENVAFGAEKGPPKGPPKGHPKVQKPQSCATATATPNLRAPPIAKVQVQQQKGSSSFGAPKVCPISIRGKVLQKLQSNGGKKRSSPRSTDNEAYVPLDYYPVPDEAPADAVSTKKAKKKPRKRIRVRNKMYSEIVDRALEILAQKATDVLHARGLRVWDENCEAEIYAVINQLILSESLPARIAAAIAETDGRVSAEEATLVENAVANNLKAAARALLKRKVEDAKNPPAAGGAAHAPVLPIAKELVERRAAAKIAEHLPPLSVITNKVENICRLAEEFFGEWGATNSLDRIEGFHVGSFLAELKAMSSPKEDEGLAKHHAGIDEIMSLLKNFNDLTQMVNEQEDSGPEEGAQAGPEAGEGEGPGPGPGARPRRVVEKADKNVGTDGGISMWIPAPVPKYCAAKKAEQLRQLAAAEQDQATDGFNKHAFYAELAAQEEAKAGLNQTVYMQTDPPMMPAEDVADLSESFAGLSVGSQEPTQEENEFGHWAQRMMSMVRDLDDLGDLVTDAIHGYRAIQQSAAENAEQIRLLAEAGNAAEQNQPEDIADPIPEIQSNLDLDERTARILLLEEQIMNAREGPELNAPMPNAVPEGIPEVNDLPKNPTDNADEMMFFDTTNDDGQTKEWYENGVKVTGKYWPMIVGGTFV
ncbi:uncharacterized protein [Drosophila pseudoobscura]|uniref:Uncharacterized protein n=1 Tax=Drosophila pseudoobscura pseudoobscura TaxID=46245 RepID=A0A6I8VI91_DROPS|nr:uncharacterized protein LOC26534429 [Drosophila pseudoobscura]XP_015041687.2 uncharacterized protein LOC26534429 [Drosophila pseudoobscura]